MNSIYVRALPFTISFITHAGPAPSGRGACHLLTQINYSYQMKFLCYAQALPCGLVLRKGLGTRLCLG